MNTSEDQKIAIPFAGYPSLELKMATEINITTFQDYQRESRKTALYPGKDNNFVYPTLGLSGESGEVAEKIKKVLRDKNGIIDDATKREISKELGDVLWYVSQISTELGLSLENIASENIKKLFSRKDRGTLKGSGDNR